MRVTEAHDILDRNIPRLEMPSNESERLPDKTTGYRYTGMSTLIAAVNELAKVAGLETECTRVRRTSMFQVGNNSGLAVAEDWRALSSALNDLKNIAARLHSVLSSMVADTSPNTIAIKLPEVKDLGELRKLLGDIQVALEHPVKMVLKETISVEGVDRGSMWLMLVGSAVLVVRFTFGILYSANAYLRRQAELDRYVEHTKAAANLHGYLKTVEEANGKLMEAFAESLTKQLLEGREVEPEAAAATMNAIKLLAELRKQGLEMQLAANAPKELKAAYKEFILPEMNGDITPKLPPQLTAGGATEPPAAEEATE